MKNSNIPGILCLLTANAPSGGFVWFADLVYGLSSETTENTENFNYKVLCVTRLSAEYFIQTILEFCSKREILVCIFELNELTPTLPLNVHCHQGCFTCC